MHTLLGIKLSKNLLNLDFRLVHKTDFIVENKSWLHRSNLHVIAIKDYFMPVECKDAFVCSG